jgi:hypothetical protein
MSVVVVFKFFEWSSICLNFKIFDFQLNSVSSSGMHVGSAYLRLSTNVANLPVGGCQRLK